MSSIQIYATRTDSSKHPNRVRLEGMANSRVPAVPVSTMTRAILDKVLTTYTDDQILAWLGEKTMKPATSDH